MFIPPEFRSKEIPPLSFEEDFDGVSGYIQGFFVTGEYFLILRHLHHYKTVDILIYIVHFDVEKCVFEKKLLTIELPNPAKKSFRRNWADLDPQHGKVVYVVEMLSNKERSIDVYYFYLVDFLKKNIKEITIKPMKADISLKYPKKEYIFAGAHGETFDLHDQDTSTLIFKAFFDPSEKKNHDDFSLQPQCRVDVLHMCKDQIWLHKTVIFDFSEWKELLDFMPGTHVNKEKIFFYDDILNESDEILKIHEYELSGKSLKSYAIDRKHFLYMFIPTSRCLMLYPEKINLKNCLLKFVMKKRRNNLIEEFKVFDTNSSQESSENSDFYLERYIHPLKGSINNL